MDIILSCFTERRNLSEILICGYFPIAKKGQFQKTFMKENLTAVETREAILAIKEVLLHLPTQYASIFIYQAVMEFGIRYVDEFL